MYFLGYSDPYVVVKYGVHEMYRTPVIHKSLNPKWNCQCTLSAPPSTTPIVIVCIYQVPYKSNYYDLGVLG